MSLILRMHFANVKAKREAIKKRKKRVHRHLYDCVRVRIGDYLGPPIKVTYIESWGKGTQHYCQCGKRKPNAR